MNMDKVSIPSPNVSSLGLFGEMPVSYFTGLPEIEVPLYSFTEGSITVPIKLSYHASGFRPDVHPGWVGAGWSLNASAWAITRKVNGKADDYNTADNEEAAGYPYFKDPYSNKSGYYFNRTALDAARWNQTSYLQDLTLTTAEMRIIGTLRDTEPDEFSFSFPNGSGKFYLDMDGTWKVDCDRAVKVTFDNTFISVPFSPIQNGLLQYFGYYKTFSGFTITDTDGTKYVYGGSSDRIEYSIDFLEQDTDLWQADSWFLKEIVDVTGRKVTFEYERAGFINQMMMGLSQNFGTGGSSSGFWQPPCGLSNGSFREDYFGRLLYPVYLKKIAGSLGSIAFNKTLSSELDFGLDANKLGSGNAERDIYRNLWQYFHFESSRPYKYIFPFLAQYYTDLNVGNNLPSNHLSMDYAYFLLTLLEWYKLDNIQVLTAGVPLKTFKLDYESGNKRLTLHSVRETSGSLTESGYTFDYNPVDNVPYFSGKLDHWGFYNGILSDVSDLQEEDEYYDSRSANVLYAKQGVLNRITYPTGGFTQFEYEGNNAQYVVPANRTEALNSYIVYGGVGGLRIKRISNSNLLDGKENGVREFFYVKNYRNAANLANLPKSGILGGESQYLFKDFKVPAGGGAWFTKNQFNSLSQLPASNNSRGSHIGYTEVVEKRSDGGYTIFYYRNFDTGNKDEDSPTINLAFSPYGPYTSLERERGVLRKTEMRTKDDIPVFRKELFHEPINKANGYVEAIRARSYTLCPGTVNQYAEATAYKNYTYAFLPVKITETTFDANGLEAMVSTKNFSYNNYKLVRTETFEDSEGRAHSYTSDYAFDTNTALYTDMTQQNIIAPVISQQHLVDNALLSVYKRNYVKGLSSNPQLILPASISVQHLSSGEEIKMLFHKYDDRGNILSYSRENGSRVNYLWGYAKCYPIAEVKNVDYSVIQNALGLTRIDQMANGKDDFSDLAILYSSSVSGFVNQLRTNANMTAAQVTTIVYAPWVGPASTADVNGKITYYGYDAFERLSSIKDHNQNFVRKYDYVYINK